MSTNELSNQPILYRFVELHTALKVAQTATYETPQLRMEAMYHVMANLRQFDQDIDKGDLFSPNEMIEDVQTPNLKYLLIPYILGEFIMNCSFGYDGRVEQLKECNLLFGKFIDRLDLLMLVTPEQKKLLNTTELNPAQIRTLKIANLKREKMLMPKLQEFHIKWAKLVRLDAKVDEDSNMVANTNAVQIEKPLSIEQDGEGDIDDKERETMLEILEFCIDKVLSYKKSIKEEEAILDHHKKDMELRALEAKHGKPLTSTSSFLRSAGDQTSTSGGSIGENNNNGGGSIDLDPIRNLSTQIGPQLVPATAQDQIQQRPIYSTNPTVSTSGVSTGGLRVHAMKSPDEAKGPIPEHMKDFMVKPAPPTNSSKQSQQQATTSQTQLPGTVQYQGLGPSAGRGGQMIDVSKREHKPTCPKHPHQIQLAQKGKTIQDVMTDEERLSKPWFNASAGTDCDCGGYEDVTLLSGYVMSAATRGGRGKLVQLCEVHNVGMDVCGCDQNRDIMKKDFIGEVVGMRTDRSRVFRDRNPYLMELSDFADMKIASGELPGIKDRQLADRIKAQDEAHRLRVENGESDDESTLLTQKEIDDIEDAETMKKREWDDWADDHQKGAGNKSYRK